MTHQPTQLLSLVGLGPVGVCVIGLQLDFLLHSSLVPDCLVGSGPPYNSTVELGWVMCHGLKSLHAEEQPLNRTLSFGIDQGKEQNETNPNKFGKKSFINLCTIYI